MLTTFFKALKSIFNKLFFCVILVQFLPTEGIAQELTGQVVDALTDQGIPFVNVVYGDQEGTITDIDGKFRIRNLKDVDHLQFSCLGYFQHRLEKDQITPYIHIELKPLQYQLDEINILPGENPALLVMRKVVENSKKHNPSSYDPYSCIIYHKMNVEFDLPKDIDYEQLPPEVKQFGINKDSYLMLFESVSEKRHLKKGIEKERIISGRVSGLRTPTMASLPALLQPFSFYDQYVKLLDREYLNPASKAGLSSYKFQLLDTLVNSVGDTIHYISYQPKKNRNFRGLTGTFHIHAPSSAIKTVAAKTTGTENGLKLFIRQNYQPVANGLWFPKQLESSLEFGSIGNTNQLPYPLIGTGKSYVTAINTEPGFSKKDFDNITLEDASILRSAPNVGVYRYEPLSAKDSATYHLIDSLGRKAHLDAIINMQLSVVRGYIPAGNFQFDLRRFIDYNDFEGLKLGMGLYTSPRMSENISTGGFFSYGFGDKTWKYGGEIQLTPHENKENKYLFEYRDDVFATGSYSYLDGINKRSSELFRGFLTETMDRTREFKVGTEFRFLKYFKSGLYYRQANVSPQKRYIFLGSDEIAPDFNFKEAEVRLKWAHRETFTKTALGLMSEGTKYPMLWLNFAYGEGEQNKSFEYNKVEVQLEKTFRYPNAMYTTIRAQGGKLDGDYPSTFLYSSFGSYKSFTIHVANTFGTMRLNEFAANEFTAVYLSHGIPLSLNTNRRVKPEIVLNTNIAWGTAPEDVYSFEKGYYESGIYLKNILSSYMLQYGLSVHYRYGPYQLENAIDNWAFKLGLEFGF